MKIVLSNKDLGLLHEFPEVVCVCVSPPKRLVVPTGALRILVTGRPQGVSHVTGDGRIP